MNSQSSNAATWESLEKPHKGKTLTTNLIKKLFAGQSDMTDYTIGITPFTDDLPKYFRIVDGPRQTGKHGL